MATYQATMYWNMAQWGWTESWYLQQETRAAAMEKLLDIAYYRSALTPSVAVLMACKIQNVDIPGDDLPEYSREAGKFGPQPTNEPAVPWAAWLCRFEAGDGRRRNLLLRGVPKSTMNYTAGTAWRAPPTIYNTDFETYVGALIRNGARIRARDNNPNDAGNKQIDAISRSPDNNQYVQLAVTAHGMIPGDKVAITKVKNTFPLKLSGIYTVTAIASANSLTVNANSPVATYPSYTGTGRIRIVSYSYPLVTAGKMLRMVKKSTGRPFFGTAGHQ